MPQHPGRSRDDELASALQAGRQAGLLPQQQALGDVLGGGDDGGGTSRAGGSSLGTSAEFFTVQDPEAAKERIMQIYREGDAPFPILSPNAADREPLTIDTSREQELIRQQAEREIQALREIEEERQRRAERARQQTLLNLAGPTLFKAISGRSTDTGLEEQMQLQREAERRAREIEEEATQKIPRLQTESELEAERLRRETQLTNEQARREQEAAEQEAFSTFLSGVLDRSTARVQAEIDKLEQQPGLGDQEDALKIARDNPQAILSNPAEIQRLARAAGTSPQLIRDTAEEALQQRRQEQGGGGGGGGDAGPAAGVQTLYQDYLTLNQKKRTAVDAGEWIEVDERQQEIMGRIRGALGSEVGQIVEQWRSGNVTTGDLRHGIELIGQARAIGLNSNIEVGGQSLSPTQVQDQLVRAIQDLRGPQGSSGSGFEALRQIQGGGQGQSQQAQSSGGQQQGGQQQQVTSQPSVFNQGAQPQQNGQQAGQPQSSQQQGGGQQGSQLQADITLTADELARLSAIGDPTTSTARKVRQRLEQEGISLGGDSIPTVRVQSQDGERVLAGVDQIQSIADEMRGRRNRGRIWQNISDAATAVASAEAKPPTPSEARNMLQNRFSIGPQTEVEVEQVGTNRGRLVINGEPQQLERLGSAQARANNIRGLQQIARGQ